MHTILNRPFKAILQLTVIFLPLLVVQSEAFAREPVSSHHQAAVSIKKPSLQVEDILSLEQAVTIALKTNLGLKQKSNQVESAEITALQRQADFYPDLELTATWSKRFDQAEDQATGQTVADELFPEQDPVGAGMRIRNVPFQVIGVLAEKGQSAMGDDQDDIILAPHTTVLFRLGDGKRVHDIVASAVNADVMDAAKAELATLLREEHRLAPGRSASASPSAPARWMFWRSFSSKRPSSACSAA